MIHGLGGTSNVWTPVLPAVARQRTVRPDLPGSGRSHRVEGPLSIERFVQAMQRVCAGLGLERVHVAAHSLGTIVAFHLAAQAPRLVRSLALFGPLLCPPDPARAAIRARGEKARAEGEAGMQAIADGLVQAAVSAETRARRPVAVAAVRELLMRQCPDGYARSCDALADAQAAEVGGIDVSDPPGHRRRGRGRARPGGAPDRRAHPRRASDGALALRPLDHAREARGVRRPAAALLRPAHVRSEG